MKRWMRPLACSIFILVLGCKKSAEPAPDGYRVAAYEAKNNHWTLIRTGTFKGQFITRRIIMVCNFYQWGMKNPVDGPDQCDLKVGSLIEPNSFPKNPEDFVDVFEMPTQTIAITYGAGNDRISQQFTVVSDEIVPNGTLR